MILVDSSVWITYFNGQLTWQSDMLDKLFENEPILIGDLILTKVLQGFKSIENNISLLHDDRDFDPMEQHLNLSVIS